MPIISEKKIKRIKEDILSLLYENPAKPLFTSHIAEEMIRDEEFILRLLNELNKEGLIDKIQTNSDGKKFLARKKWTLKSNVYSQYKQLINH
jgi:predicted transcriptional regulator